MLVTELRHTTTNVIKHHDDSHQICDKLRQFTLVRCLGFSNVVWGFGQMWGVGKGSWRGVGEGFRSGCGGVGEGLSFYTSGDPIGKTPLTYARRRWGKSTPKLKKKMQMPRMITHKKGKEHEMKKTKKHYERWGVFVTSCRNLWLVQ